MSTVDVDLEVHDAIASSLETGAQGLEGLSGGVPAGIDAGPMTAVITGMLSQIVDSAGNVSTSLTSAAEGVRLSRRYYEQSDASAQSGLEAIRKAMTP
jgi:hypothetical protein